MIAYERDYFYGLVFLDMLPIMLLGMVSYFAGVVQAPITAFVTPLQLQT